MALLHQNVKKRKNIQISITNGPTNVSLASSHHPYRHSVHLRPLPNLFSYFAYLNLSVYVKYIHMKNEKHWMDNGYSRDLSTDIDSPCLEASFSFFKNWIPAAEPRAILL